MGIPSRLWATVTVGPEQKVIVPEEPEEEKKGALSTSSIIIVALGASIGGSVVLGCLFVLVWYCATRRSRKLSKVAPEPTPQYEVRQVSDGGYRTKTVKVGGDVPESPTEKA